MQNFAALRAVVFPLFMKNLKGADIRPPPPVGARVIRRHSSGYWALVNQTQWADSHHGWLRAFVLVNAESTAGTCWRRKASFARVHPSLWICVLVTPNSERWYIWTKPSRCHINTGLLTARALNVQIFAHYSIHGRTGRGCTSYKWKKVNQT